MGLSRHPHHKTTAKSAAAALGLALAGVAAAATPTHPVFPPPFTGPVAAGLMAVPRDREVSGLAPSRRADDLLWTHNDSGDGPVLYALGGDGRDRGRLRLAGIRAEDWEDLASFELDGQAWLLAADVGDNFANRPLGVLHVVAEPAPASLAPGVELVEPVAWSLHFRYEDGPRDCEAVAVDPRDRSVWLLTKRDHPARLYRLDLAPAPATQPARARFVGTVTGLPQPTARQRLVAQPLHAYRGQPTALDFSADGAEAVVLTYGALLLYRRGPGEDWVTAFARPPVALAPHGLLQAEAACFSRDGLSLFVCSEGSRRWRRYDRRQP